MPRSLGIRHEDVSATERRTPLVPADVTTLIHNTGVEILVESSGRRIFSDEAYIQAGARLTDDVTGCDVVVGVKEMPVGTFRKGGVYLFFSHVIKGQQANMPMLADIVQSGATLIDYERIADNNGRRKLFFGRHAGLAGTINTLWTLGQRLKAMGVDTPLGELKQACRYNRLSEAVDHIKECINVPAHRLLPAKMRPLIIAVTGGGNVARGALELLDMLPTRRISPADLLNGLIGEHDEVVRVVNICPADYLVHRDGKRFSMREYTEHPDRFENRFPDFLPHMHVLINGIYWDERYPKLLTLNWLKQHAGSMRLHAVGDITCDPGGSVECTVKATKIDDPVYIYNPETGSLAMGFEGPGLAVMAVDILPSELAHESSAHFSAGLFPYLHEVLGADFGAGFSDLRLPEDLKRAVIVHKGQLTPSYRYLERFLK